MFRRNGRVPDRVEIPETQQRRGLYKAVFHGKGLINNGMRYDVTAEVTELDRIGLESKLRVDAVYGIDVSMRKNVGEQIEGWHQTANVIWRDEHAA